MHSRIELYYWLSKAREGLVLVCSIITSYPALPSSASL